MGGSSPTVFHTTPPQPASNARSTLYALSVGGAEASQNGFGLVMPTKVVVRSAMQDLLRLATARLRLRRAAFGRAQEAVDGNRRALAVLDRLHREIAAAVGAIAAGPNLGVRSDTAVGR